MADIKTHYRELSFAIKLHSLIHNSPISSDISDPKSFYKECQNRIDNSVDIASNILSEPINPEYLNIINNGFKLANAIYHNNHFNFKTSDKIYWVGSETQKDDLIDVQVVEFGFSLKEDSFILENMGLYKYLNIFTNGNFKRGIHVFNDFAKNEYDSWFNVTWQLLLDYLKNHKSYIFTKEGFYKSTISIENNNVILDFCNIKKPTKSKVSKIPCSISSWNEFTKNSSSPTREKAFAKWISENCSDNPEYLKSKSICSDTAGKNLVKYIKDNLQSDNIRRFLQIYPEEYYYAKTTDTFTGVYLVPSLKDFNNTYDVKDIKYSVPSSQLNLITTIENKITKEQLVFRNECRFSHGQFNGTPEAKMYYDKGNDLSLLYNVIISES